MYTHEQFKEKDGKESHPSSRCNLCGKDFLNRYVRDFHINNVHCTGLKYTCYICEENPEASESDIYFNCVYTLHMHKHRIHEENGYTIYCFLDI